MTSNATQPVTSTITGQLVIHELNAVIRDSREEPGSLHRNLHALADWLFEELAGTKPPREGSTVLISSRSSKRGNVVPEPPAGTSDDHRRAVILYGVLTGATWERKTIAARFGVSGQTIINDTNALIAAGLIRAEGETRGRRYHPRRPALDAYLDMCERLAKPGRNEIAQIGVEEPALVAVATPSR